MHIRASVVLAISTIALASPAATDTALAGTPSNRSFERITPERAFVGTLSGSDAFVAILVGRRGGVRVYVYDSNKRITAWSDPAFGRAVRLEAAGSALTKLNSASTDGFELAAEIGSDSAFGTMRFQSGVRHLFAAHAVAVTDGVYKIEIGRGVGRYLGGWIVWQPGRNLGYLAPAPIVTNAGR